MVHLGPPKILPKGYRRGAGDCPTRISVYIAEQNRLAAEYLMRILSHDRDFAPAFLENLIPNHVSELRDPVFVLDRSGIDLPVSECIHVLNQRCQRPKMIVLGDDLTSDDNISELLALGTHGFIGYSKVRNNLKKAIRAVADSKLWFSAKVLQLYVERSTHATVRRRFGPSRQDFTERERQILEMVKRRLSNREIAALLGIRECTVKFHLSNVFSKLQINKRSELRSDDTMNQVWRRLAAS